MRKVLAPAVVAAASLPRLSPGPTTLPRVEHQPALCTVPEKPLSLCAAISDDGNVATARLYFRRAGEDYYAFVNMAFTGVSYCGTLPGPREKTKAIEYYVQAVDDNYQPHAHEHLPPPRAARGRLRVPARREGRGEGGGHQGPRHEPQAGEEARRRLQPDRRHVCPASLGPSPSSLGLLAAAAVGAGRGRARRVRLRGLGRPAARGARGRDEPRGPGGGARSRSWASCSASGARPASPAGSRRAAKAPCSSPSPPRARAREPTPSPSSSSTRSRARPTAPATRRWPASGRGCSSRSGRARPRRCAWRRIPLRLDVRGELAVRLESADGEPHRVRLRALPARGLRAEGDGAEVAVPARGTAPAALPLVRAGAARGSRHAVLLVAEATDGPLARTAVLAVPVEVAAVPLAAAAPPRAAPRRSACCSWPSPSVSKAGVASALDTRSDRNLWCRRDGEAQGLLPAARRAARREPHRHQEGLPAARAAVRPEEGGRRRRDSFAELQAAYETLTDAERRTPVRRRAGRRGAPDRRSTGPSCAVPRRGTCGGPSPRPASPPRSSSSPRRRRAGTVLSLDVPVTATCDGCGGTGGSVFDCDRCQGEGKVARRLPVPVHVPAGLRDGTVFQVRTDDPAVPSILLTVHVRRV